MMNQAGWPGHFSVLCGFQKPGNLTNVSCYTIFTTKSSQVSARTFQLHQPAYEEVTRRILAASDPTQIIVFGSHAREEGTPDSDLDILVVLDEVESTRAESIRLRRALRGLMYPFDIIISTPEQLARYRHIPGLIYKTILDEGKVIYERPLAG
jgi:predicted nucleotidyltransferase